LSTNAKQRFLDLDVNELSLVDNPANELEFLVVKNQSEESQMGAQQQSTPDDVEVIKVQADGTAAVLGHVENIVKNLSSLIGNVDTEKAKGTTPKGEPPQALKGKMPKAMQKALTEAGATTELLAALEKSVDDFSTLVTTEKSVESKEEGVEEETEKARTLRKAFVSKLTEVHKLLSEIVQEVSQGPTPKTLVPALSAAPMSGITQQMSGSETARVTKAVADELTPHLKELFAPVMKGLNDLAELSKKHGEEIETIKAARSDSNTLGEDPAPKPVEKAKSLFSNII
jgi:hypothetical protein